MCTTNLAARSEDVMALLQHLVYDLFMMKVVKAAVYMFSVLERVIKVVYSLSRLCR